MEDSEINLNPQTPAHLKFTDADMEEICAQLRREHEETLAFFGSDIFNKACADIKAHGGGDLEAMQYGYLKIPGVDAELFYKVFDAVSTALAGEAIQLCDDFSEEVYFYDGLMFSAMHGQGTAYMIKAVTPAEEAEMKNRNLKEGANRFWLFAGTAAPTGGFSDYIGSAATSEKAKELWCGDEAAAWWQVVDSKTRQLVDSSDSK